MNRWTGSEIKILKKMSEYCCNETLSAIFDRSLESIKMKKKSLGLKMSKEKRSEFYSNKIKSQNLDLYGESNPNWKGGISKDNYHYKKIQKQRHPEKTKAREILYYNIRNGKIITQPCENCGIKKTHGHHDDYSKPLEVRWLCRKHHRELHGGKH